MRLIFTTILLLAILTQCGQKKQEENREKENQKEKLAIPEVYSNIAYNEEGTLGVNGKNGDFYPLRESDAPYSLSQFQDGISGNEKGLQFEFNDTALEGTLYYGLQDPESWRYPQPVFFKNPVEIVDGKSMINIRKELAGKYDMVGWEAKGRGTLGYRVTNEEGKILYDGQVTFVEENGRFKVATYLTEGPLLYDVRPDGVTVAFSTNEAVEAQVKVDGKTFSSNDPTKKHRITVEGLKPNHRYNYKVQVGDMTRTFDFNTAPKVGSDTAFTFAYTSDSRAGKGGGERDIHGANGYIMKKMAALALQQDAAFLQFTGDFINGYLQDKGAMNLEYANWKGAIDPFASYLPLYPGMGNHEAFVHSFDDGSHYGLSVDQFPFAENSAETVFAENFVTPANGPESEDGARYDPESGQQNFPSYQNTVYHYTYGNVAMIVLNSDYWYAPSLESNPITSGNLHGYIMDQQLRWFEQTLQKLENNEGIDHIFVTQHTPVFPNGGHVDDDMWYDGSNEYRPYVDGEPVEQGIIERRDEYLDLVVNESEKVRAILTGDEHNYNRLPITDAMPRYPEGYEHEKLALEREILQINNGAAGAPYYGREKTPWMDHVQNFTTQNALVLFHVKGEEIEVEVMNPETLEVFDRYEL